MRTTVTPPGPGTLGLLAEYGPRLVVVRYRYDAQKKWRYKTAEIIVDEVYWQPPRKKKKGPPLGLSGLPLFIAPIQIHTHGKNEEYPS